MGSDFPKTTLGLSPTTSPPPTALILIASCCRESGFGLTYKPLVFSITKERRRTFPGLLFPLHGLLMGKNWSTLFSYLMENVNFTFFLNGCCGCCPAAQYLSRKDFITLFLSIWAKLLGSVPELQSVRTQFSHSSLILESTRTAGTAFPIIFTVGFESLLRLKDSLKTLFQEGDII